jgi:hypothetical protein
MQFQKKEMDVPKTVNYTGGAFLPPSFDEHAGSTQPQHAQQSHHAYCTHIYYDFINEQQGARTPASCFGVRTK